MSDPVKAKMFAEEVGLATGPPMMAVHGFLSSNAQWFLNQDALGQQLRLIMIELLGHGRSASPDREDAYTIDSLVAELERIRKAHNIEKWWVCGQSLGGAISVHYCLRHPERVHGLVFTNTRAAFGIKREGVSRDANNRPPAITSTRDLPVHPINATRLDESIKSRMVEAADRMELHCVELYMKRRHTWKSTDRMAELTMPVLLVNGRWEKSFQPFVEQAQELIADLEVVTLEGGHAINAERPEEFNRAVLDFVDRRGGSDAQQTG